VFFAIILILLIVISIVIVIFSICVCVDNDKDAIQTNYHEQILMQHYETYWDNNELFLVVPDAKFGLDYSLTRHKWVDRSSL
jgi:hypothetical protein